MGENQNLINRRTVTKGMAWSVPAVAAATAAPAFAVSGGGPTGTLDAGFKYPGNACGYPESEKVFGFQVTVKNDTDQTIWLYTATTTVTVGTETFTNNSPITQSVALAPGEEKTFVFLMQNANSGNFSGDATMLLDWGHTQNPADETHDHPSVVLSKYIASFPPSKDCTYAVI